MVELWEGEEHNCSKLGLRLTNHKSRYLPIGGDNSELIRKLSLRKASLATSS